MACRTLGVAKDFLSFPFCKGPTETRGFGRMCHLLLEARSEPRTTATRAQHTRWRRCGRATRREPV